MSKEIHEIVTWANDIAHRYNIGITNIVDAYMKANDNTGSADEAKQFVEQEIKSVRGICNG